MSASRAARRSGAPIFATYAEVEVDIDPSELERAGWVYVGKKDEPTTERVIDVVMRWHDDNHEGPWRWCRHDLCDALRGRGEES